MIKSLLAAKEATGKSFTHIGQDLGLTNTYAAQRFYNQVAGLILHPASRVAGSMFQSTQRCAVQRLWRLFIRLCYF